MPLRGHRCDPDSAETCRNSRRDRSAGAARLPVRTSAGCRHAAPPGLAAATVGWLLYAMAAELVRECYDIRLELSADIGPGFWIGHFGGIELAHCQLGERCTVGQHDQGRASWRGRATAHRKRRVDRGARGHIRQPSNRRRCDDRTRVRASSETSPVGLWSSGTPAVSPCAVTTIAQSSAQVESHARGCRYVAAGPTAAGSVNPAQGEAQVHGR